MSRKMATGIDKDISFLNLLEEKYLECALCQDIYTNPKSLDCQHTFCEKCLQDYMKDKNGILICPLCRTETAFPDSGVKDLKNNFLLKSMICEAKLFKDNKIKCNNCCEDKIAIMVCSDCSLYMCQECFKIHQGIRINRENHNTFEVAKLKDIKKLQEFQFNRFSMCDLHKEPQKLFCKTDGMMVCTVCIHTADHKGHEVCSIHEKINDLTFALEKEIEKADILNQEMDKKNENIKLVIATLDETQDLSLNKIEKEKNELIEIIQNRAKELEDEIKTRTQTAKETLNIKLLTNGASTELIEEKTKQSTLLKLLPVANSLQAADLLLKQFKENIPIINIEELDETDVTTVRPFIAADRETFLKAAIIGKPITKNDSVVLTDNYEEKCGTLIQNPGYVFFTNVVTPEIMTEAGQVFIKWQNNEDMQWCNTGKDGEYDIKLPPFKP